VSKDAIIDFGWVFVAILGCAQPVIWFFGSLAVYCSLERPMWELALVVVAPLFVFIKCCLWVVGRRPSGSGSVELPEADDVAEERTEPSNWSWAGDTLLQKTVSYMMMGSIVGLVFIVCLFVPLALVGMTWGFWEGWADGSSQWMRSPARLLGAIWGFLALACLGVQVISWVTLPEEPETSEESPRKKRGEPAGRDPEATDKSPPPPPDVPA